MELNDNKDRIDFGIEDIPVLFRKMFVPTLLGMLSMSLITVVDGIFVGQGVGSNGLASVNVAAPLFMLFTGLGLMFGIGASVVVTIYLSKNKFKAASITFSQTLTVSVVFVLIVTVLLLLFNRQVAQLFGATELLMPSVLEYMNWIIPFSVFSMITVIGLFFIRLDGSPKYAMYCNVVPAVLNVFLDYIFVFPLGWGLKGAAFASGISMTTGGIMVIYYLFFMPQKLRFYKPRFSRKSLILTAKNIIYILTLGFSAFIAETALAFMTAMGNNVFVGLLGEDGIAAYSIACYLFPILFMIGNSIAQSAQPIISFNYGAGNKHRSSLAALVSIKTALVFGALTTSFFVFFSKYVVSLFLDESSNAFRIAVDGIPYFSLASLFFMLNIVVVGYFQSVERHKVATFIIVLRGYFFLFVSFIVMSKLFSTTGAWLAVPVAEILMTVLLVVNFVLNGGNVSLMR